uniref:Sugar phosphate transporter domain-containing protein n=1 Tax=Aureoumbra lagunensis TaxID=44058 RepID=A0A7S3NGJ4_9STRA
MSRVAAHQDAEDEIEAAKLLVSKKNLIEIEDDKGLRRMKNGRLIEKIKLILIWIFYLTAGPSTIFLNSYLLKQVHFPYPAALSLLGVLSSSLVSSSLIFAGLVSGNQMKQLTIRSYIIRVMPIGLALAGTLAFGNEVYLQLSVAFIQILKAFSPVILLCLLLIAQLETPRSLLFLAIGIIVLGTAAATQGELHATVFGLVCMFFSEFFEAVKAIFLQLLLSPSPTTANNDTNHSDGVVKKKFEAMESLAVFGPAACLCLTAVSYFTEDLHDAFTIICQHPLLFLLASCSGLAVNLATSLFIKYTSALTLRVTSLGRNVGIVLISACIFPDSRITLEEFFGYSVCLVGCLLYQHARSDAEETIDSLSQRLFGIRIQSLLSKNPCSTKLPPPSTLPISSSQNKNNDDTTTKKISLAL